MSGDSPRQQKRRSKFSLEIEEFIGQEAVGRDATPVEADLVHARLQEAFPRTPFDELPHPKTIQRRIKKINGEREQSEQWRLTRDAASQDARRILDALGSAYVEKSNITDLSMEEAQWVTLIGRLEPALSGESVYRLARSYVSHEREREPTDGLDLLLALRPWSRGTGGRVWLDSLEQQAPQRQKERLRHARAIFATLTDQELDQSSSEVTAHPPKAEA